MLVLAVAAVWILLLGGLAFWTANPVTLNLAAISTAQESGAVIVGEVVGVKKAKSTAESTESNVPNYSVRVTDVLGARRGFTDDFGIAVETSVGIVDDSGYKPKVGEKLILPLWLHPSVHLMQTTGRPYPATPQMIANVKNALGGAAPSGR